MRVDFPKKSNLLMQKQKCGISNDVFSSFLAEVTNCSVCESRTAEPRDIVYSLCESETAELQVTEYSLCGGGTAGLISQSPCMLCHFRAPSHTLFCMRKRNCGTLSFSIFLVRRRNLKSHNSLCAEAVLQVT